MAIDLESLAVIGNRRTLAMVTKEGTICWYCPGRFDFPSLFASLLDEEKGGKWEIEWEKASYAYRDYEEDSAILRTVHQKDQEENTVIDFMPAGEGVPHGICRLFQSSASTCYITIHPAPDYAQMPLVLKEEKGYVSINGKQCLYSSKPLKIVNQHVELVLEAAHSAWIFLSDQVLDQAPAPERWLEATRLYWKEVAGRFSYYGPYESQVAESIRAIRLLTHETNGGILAAGTTSLPEVPGGERNYDYRFIWLRDAGMIVSALIRAGSNGVEERRFLNFISGLEKLDDIFFSPMYTLDQKLISEKQELPLSGYRNSRPVSIGNSARKQLQLGTTANVLIAAKLIYNKYDTREHWETIAETADFLADNWQREDNGIWEENVYKHYTSSKVITAVGLKYIAEHARNPAQKKKWKEAESRIRKFVQENCINAEGAYAVAAGEEAVDISAILFPTWGYTAMEAPEVLHTVRLLEQNHRVGKLYRRHLFEFDSQKEGAFLAGSLWMAQYWIYRHAFDKAREILDEVLQYSTDLGFFSEEADVFNKRMLGNIPQAFVHASFIGAVIDLKEYMEQAKKSPPPKEKQ